MHRKTWMKVALAASACLFVLWWVLGTGATLAWFTDSESVRNDFQVGKLDLDVSFKNDVVTEYTPLDNSTAVFNDRALYEPGYTQVVYLKIENKGDRAFDFKTAVSVTDYTQAINYYGQEFCLRENSPELHRIL